MRKKEDFIHIRSDEELHAALQQAAARNDRKMTDHARYLLRVALGLVPDDEDAKIRERVKKSVRHPRSA